MGLPWTLYRPLHSRRHNLPINKKNKSHPNNQFNLINICIKTMAHNLELSTGIALFILGKAANSHFPYHWGGVVNQNHFVSGEHSSLAGLQWGWNEIGSENISNFSQLLWPPVKYSVCNYFKMKHGKENKERKTEKRTTKLWCKKLNQSFPMFCAP